MQRKLAEIARRYDELSARMGAPEIYEISGEFQRVAKEVGRLEPLVLAYRRLVAVEAELKDTRELLVDEDDPEMRELAELEAESLEAENGAIIQKLRLLLLPKDPNDEKNIVLEIRAGTGGEEAALFSADLFRMYSRFAERKKWRVEILSASTTDSGGYKEVIALVTGQMVYSTLKFEMGVHRVQRVPATESQGRIHTSACTVAVLPEAEEVELNVPAQDLRIDTYRASGPGGQSVNTTDSAIRITHIPTGLVVQCQDEKSQHKNREKALKVLMARLYDKFQAEAHAERADARRSQVGSGDRSERIRTYNFPQNRVTDHRIGLTLYKLDEVIQGNMASIIEPVAAARQADLLQQQTAV